MADAKIDVHAHFISPGYREALLKYGHDKPDGMPYIPAWSAESHLKYMDSHGISKSIISVSSPGTCMTTDRAINQRITRECNDFAAKVKARYPNRFGYFASLPLPDIEASLAEIEHVLDGTLKADGFLLFSNAEGLYLGDPHLRPILSQLQSRHAIAFIHPTLPCHHAHVHENRSIHDRYALSSPLATAYGAPTFEYFFDSGRSVLDLLMSGTAHRFNGIRWIITHGGGALPSLIDRAFMMMLAGLKCPPDRDPMHITVDQIRELMAEYFWFDLAGNPVPNQINSLLKLTRPDRLVFGTDVPWTPFEVSGKIIQQVEQDLPSCVGEENLELVYSKNAKQLFPAQTIP
ncbi:hypothetical protein ACLMJK_005420 [Lecanora helva]